MRPLIDSMLNHSLPSIRFLVLVFIPFVLGPALGFAAGQGVALVIAPPPSQASGEEIEPIETRWLTWNRYSVGGAVAGLIVGPFIACALARRMDRKDPDLDDDEPFQTSKEASRLTEPRSD
ncbi:hypothetical protein BH23PLA1_BH23PLA1_27180 [soil metagenome]